MMALLLVILAQEPSLSAKGTVRSFSLGTEPLISSLEQLAIAVIRQAEIRVPFSVLINAFFINFIL
jgi:hypothetical protein